MNLIRRIVTTTEEPLRELGEPVHTPVRKAAAVAVVANPWLDSGIREDLSAEVGELAPFVAHALADRLLTTLGGAAKVEAFGKAAIVGLDGEIEHGSGLIHTLKFGNYFRDAARASTLLPAVEKRAPAGTVFDIPLKHVTDATIRSHHQSVEVRVPDAPRAEELIVGLAAAAQGRPQARLAPLANEQ